MAWLDLESEVGEMFADLVKVDRRACAHGGAEHLSVRRRGRTRAEMRVDGLCICGRPLRVHKGKVRSECAVCAIRSSKKQRERHAANTAAGACWCGDPRAVRNGRQLSRCETHLASEVARAEAKRRSLAKSGLCRCGRKAAEGRLECQPCLDRKHRSYMRRNWAQW